MRAISKDFYRMPSNVMHFVIAPLFLFIYVLIVDPYHVSTFLSYGGSSYTLNLTFVTVIALAVLSLTRMLLFILRRVLHMTWAVYFIWCLGEMAFVSLFQSLYMALVLHGAIPYFSVLSHCFWYLAMRMAYPYLVLALLMHIHYLKHKEEELPDERSLIRFYDEYKKLRLIIAQEAVLYIKSEQNYVYIHYLDNGRPKTYNLRSSMRALEDTLSRHGLVRCHRSFFVNPDHIRLVRKDSSGYAIAELDTPGLENVLISKTYYSSVSQFL